MYPFKGMWTEKLPALFIYKHNLQLWNGSLEATSEEFVF